MTASSQSRPEPFSPTCQARWDILSPRYVLGLPLVPPVGCLQGGIQDAQG